MADFLSQEAAGSEALGVDAELAGLIGAIVNRARSSADHPSNALLAALDTDVEDTARALARQEIHSLAEQIAHEAASRAEQAANIPTKANPFAPIAPAIVAPDAVEPVSKPVTWIGEAFEAQAASKQAESWDSMAARAEIEPAPIEDTQAAYDETELVSDDKVVTPQIAAGGGGDWFGHSPDGLPAWLSMGVPVAAVSIFALGIIATGGFSGDLQAPALRVEETASVKLASLAPEASPLKPANASLRIREAETVFAEIDNSSVTSTAKALASVPAGDTATTPSSLIVPVSQNTPVSTGAGGSSIVGLGRKAESPIDTPLASAPSVKPEALVQSPVVSARTINVAPAPIAKRRRKIPVRMFSGRMDPGSAAQIVNAMAQRSGPVLTRTEQFWLARDVERVFENEIDGRSVSVKSRQGQRVRVTLEKSSQVQRDFTISRANELSALPHNMVLEGGWYAARRDVALHAGAALGTGLKHRILKRGDMIERMATYTDRYGDRWYLMGQRGHAVGFLSAGDVLLADAYQGELGNPYAASQGARTHDVRTVYTKCRDSFIGPEGGLVQRLSVCRDAKGHWVGHDESKVSTRQASLAGPLLPKAGTASAIVLAEATGDPIAYHAFGNRLFRRRLQADLVHARFGQTTEQVLPNGDPIHFTFGDTYVHEALLPVKRTEAVMTVSSKLRVKAGWMKVPIGAQLRASPDYLAQSMGEGIKAGRAVETMGYVKGIRNGEDWALIGRSGVAFGYVPAAKLADIEGRVSPHAMSNARGVAVADLVETVSACRTVEYITVTGAGQFDACQQPDNSWALKAEPDLKRQFAYSTTNLKTAP